MLNSLRQILTQVMPFFVKIAIRVGFIAKDAEETQSIADRVRTNPRRVKFASLDSINGQRLFEGRNELRNKRKRPAPIKRTDGEKPLTRFFAKNKSAKIENDLSVAPPVLTPAFFLNNDEFSKLLHIMEEAKKDQPLSTQPDTSTLSP